MILALPYPPTANLYWRVVHGRPIKSKAAREYQTKVALLAKSSLGPFSRPLEGPVTVKLSVYRPRRLGDLDNTLKVILDALKGIAFIDDSQVVHIEAHRNDDAANPRAIITVAAAERGAP